MQAARRLLGQQSRDARDNLVILDWEDYGRECLPGYDLALLLLALNGFSAARVRENTRDGAAHAWILQAGSEGTGIPPALFLRLLPAYLALTVRMKTEMAYGPGTAVARDQRAGGIAHADFARRKAAETLMTSVRRALAIAMAENQLTFALQFVVAVIVARLLTPDEIGVYSIAVITLSAAHVIRDFGVVAYLVKESDLSVEKVRAASAISFGISWTLAVLIALASFPLARFYNEPRLLHLTWVLALNFVMIPVRGDFDGGPAP